MKTIASLNEIDPLSALGAKLVKPSPPSDAELRERAMREFEAAPPPIPRPVFSVVLTADECTAILRGNVYVGPCGILNWGRV